MGIIKHIEHFLKLIYPDICHACQTLLVEGEDTICTQCLVSLPKTNDSFNGESHLFTRFNALYPCSIVSSFLYLSKKGKVESMLYELKYKGKYKVGFTLGLLFGKSLMNSPLFCPEEYEWIIPVPIHKKRIKTRGYNQSTAIAEGLSKATGIALNENICKRVYATKSQTSKSKFARFFTMESAFEVVKPELLTPDCGILIVDDVITTGATIDSLCKKIHLFNKVKHFGILSLARK